MTRKKIKIQIKSLAGNLLFEYEAVDNTIRRTLEKAVVGGAKLWGADLREANLGRADLWGADLREANLGRADLREANLGRADLGGVDLREANLWRADLREAKLWGADLREANLGGADLRRADLREAKLWGADLWGADLREAKNLPNIYKTSLSLLKYQPKNIKLRAFKYLNGNKSPYQDFEYEIGKTYPVEESNDDETILCAKGINIATLDWCLRDTNCDLTKTYVEVEFCVKDLIIPYNSDGKFRIKKGGKVKFIRKLTQKELKETIKPLNSTKKKEKNEKK